MTSARYNDGQSTAACAFSPHSPQPTQPSITVATGSVRSGSGLSLMVSVGQPESRMHEWSPVQVSSSTPRSEEHTSELQSLTNLVCRLLLEKKKQNKTTHT